METLFLLVYEEFDCSKDKYLITAPNLETAKGYLAEELGTDKFDLLHYKALCRTQNYVSAFMSDFD